MCKYARISPAVHSRILYGAKKNAFYYISARKWRSNGNDAVRCTNEISSRRQIFVIFVPNQRYFVSYRFTSATH